MNYEYSILALILSRHLLCSPFYIILYVQSILQIIHKYYIFLILLIYIGCLSLCLPARLLSVDSVSLIGQMAAEPQVDAAQVNGAEMKVSHLSQFVFTNSVHPVRVCLRSSSLQLCNNIWGIIMCQITDQLHSVIPLSGHFTLLTTATQKKLKLDIDIHHAPELRLAYLAFAEQFRVMVS